MRSKRNVWALVLVAGVCVPKVGRTQVSVGPTVQVTRGRPADQFYEVQIAADPDNADRLLACSFVLTSANSGFNSVVYASFDRGRTWDLTYELARGHYTQDPTCDYGLNGAAYAVFLGYDAVIQPRRIRTYFARSRDTGKTWDVPLVLRSLDREYVAIDRTQSPYRGRVYVNGTGVIHTIDGPAAPGGAAFTSLTVLRSDDGGVTFGSPVQIASTGDHWFYSGGKAAILSDGTYIVPFGERMEHNFADPPKPLEANAALKVAVSADGGDTFRPAVKVSDWYQSAPNVTQSPIPALAADPGDGPFRDRLYVVWPDVRSGRAEIFLAYSGDKGHSWSKPIVVSEADNSGDSSLPQVAVNSSGVVGVSWYDRRENRGDGGWRVRFRASLDGGDSFLPSVKVSDASSGFGSIDTLTLEASQRGALMRSPGGPMRADFGPGVWHFRGGDTAGLVADAMGTFHALWVDNRTGNFQLYTGPVTVQARATRNGLVELADLSDVSDDVTISYSNARFIRATKTVLVDAKLVNASKQPLNGPFKLRVLEVSSVLGGEGGAAIANADNGVSGSGAVWNYTAQVLSGVLAPGDSSRAKRLEFKVSGSAMSRPPSDEEDLERWVTVRFRAYARIASNK